jgi:hypothetical protein
MMMITISIRLAVGYELLPLKLLADIHTYIMDYGRKSSPGD